MRAISRRFIYALSNKIRALRQSKPEDSQEKKLIVDFAKTKKPPFDIKSESSFDAYLSDSSLALGLKKINCIARVQMPEPEYRDHVIKAKIRLDSPGGYAAAGIMFRIMDKNSYYMALVSSEGYFRFDIVKDNASISLITWTEISDFDGTNIDLDIITFGTYLIFIVNGSWVGEINNDSINSGRLGFALVSYPVHDRTETEMSDAGTADADKCICKAFLDYFSVDARIAAIENKYKQWTDDTNINAGSRLRLAETFAVMGESAKAMDQINRAWKRRDDAIRSVSATYTEVRTRRELLLAARMSFNLGQYNEAEEFIDAILEQWSNSAEGKSAYAEKMRVLNELNKFTELKEFAFKHSEFINKDLDYYTMLACCYWELEEYADSAEAWEKAFRMNSENGVYAANAANALELTGKKEKALSLFLEAGKLFLKQDNFGELAALDPRLSVLGSKDWEARALLGKWAFSIEDYDRCLAEFIAAEKLRRAFEPRPEADPALYYLFGLVLSLKGRNKNAVYMVERAVKLAPDYGLFRFKLIELKLSVGLNDPDLAEELKFALEHIDNDMKEEMAGYAGNLLLNAGDAENAQYFFDKAGSRAQEQ